MIKTEIVGHSLNPQGDELISVLCTFPRIILAEVNTHRMLSKNTSSSRAIPFNKMVEAVKENPFIPIAWQREHSGMQGTEYLTAPIDIAFANDMWLEARDRAIRSAKAMNKVGTDNRSFVTKQLCNRLLEPFMWTTMLITGSREGWDNFFNLRCPVYYYAGNDKSYKSKKELLPILLNDFGKSPADSFWYNINKGQAEIHMMALAESIYDAVNESFHTQILPTMWHVPFRKKINELYPEVENDSEDIVKISVSMAARASYTVVGTEKILTKEEHISLHDRLLAQDPPHSSPLEHCARAMSSAEYESFYKGQIGLGGESGWCNNLKGFIPYRYFIDNNLTF